MRHVTKWLDVQAMPEHTQHWSDDVCPRSGLPRSYRTARICKTGIDRAGHYYVFFNESGEDAGYQHEFYGLDRLGAIRKVFELLTSIEAQEGDIVTTWVNQANRDAEILYFKRTRARIEYEMPNAGYVEAWRPYFTLNNRRYILEL